MHRRLIAYARQARLPLATTVLSGLSAGLCSLGQAYAISAIVAGVFLGHQNLTQIWGWLRFLLIIIAGRSLLIAVNEIAAKEVAIRVKTGLRQKLFGHLLALGPAYSRGERTGEVAATVVEGIEALDGYFSQYLPQLVVSVLVPAVMVLVVFPIDPLSGAILLVTAPLIPFFMYMIGKSAESASKRQYETLGRLSSHFLDGLQGLTTLKLFGQSKAHARNIAAVCDQFRAATLKVMQVSFLSAFALELIATISTAIIAVEVGLRLLYGQMPFQQALFVLLLAPEFYLPLRQLGIRFHAGSAGTSAARRIFQILDAHAASPEPSPEPWPKTGELPLSPETLGARNAGIQLTDVTYAYPDAARPALREIDLTIPVGQHLAVVGASGAGKTTLAHLLLGFMQPTCGSITILGRPPRHADSSADLQIAWAPQNPYLLHDSIAANMRLGNPGATMAELEQAARCAHLRQFVETLPDGYDTVIGESGARLSSGEAQRLALARAFLADAPILILDEPTSSLDPENESLLEQSLRQLEQGRTVITIAHRLNTVRRADKIVVLEDGAIVETGTHDELMLLDGTYARFVKSGWAPSTEVAPMPDASGAMTRAGGIIPSAALAQGITPSTISRPFEQPDQAGLGSTLIMMRLLAFLNGMWGWIALAVLLATLTIGSSVALTGTSAWLISAAALHPPIAALAVAIVGVRFFGIARAVLRYTERLVSHSVTLRLLRNIRVWFYERLEPLAPARLMEYRAGDVLSRVMADVEALENLYVRILAPPMTALLVAAAVSAFFILSGTPQLAVVLAASFVLVGVVLPGLVNILGQRAGLESVRLRAALHSQVVDGIQGMSEIVAYGRAKDRLAGINETGAAQATSQRSMSLINGLQAALSSLASNATLWIALLLVVPLVNAGSLSGVMLAPLALVTLASFEATTPLPVAAQLWPATQAAARRLFEMVDAKPAVDESTGSANLMVAERDPSSAAALKRANLDLEIRNLSFTYPGQTIPALRGATLSLPTGGALGIVGPSGAGKSTIARLLLRFWDYDSGEVRLGGESIRIYSPQDVRAHIGVVAQDAYFFDTSIYENLRLARRGVTRADVENAAQEAQIHDFIRSLPAGYETLIGEHGTRLSAGERQRLAIARVLIKDPPLLILDEPTANLDTVTESRILETLLGVMAGRSTLLITHRLVGLDRLDEIVVMDKGNIVEAGSFDQLQSARGLFSRLWELQAHPWTGRLSRLPAPA